MTLTVTHGEAEVYDLRGLKCPLPVLRERKVCVSRSASARMRAAASSPMRAAGNRPATASGSGMRVAAVMALRSGVFAHAEG